MMENNHTNNHANIGKHKFSMEQRRDCTITGVVEVHSFDENNILMETVDGMLAIKGENLHVSHLNLEKGEADSPKKPSLIKPHNIREGRVESDGALQLSFFQLEDPLLSSLKEELEAADLNNLTPLQAFDLLRSMKEKMGLD